MRWWASEEASRSMLGLVDDSDVVQGVATAVLGYHGLTSGVLGRLASETLVDGSLVKAALSGVDLTPVSKALGEATRPVMGDAAGVYGAMLAEAIHDDAMNGTLRLVSSWTSSGMPWPHALERAAEVHGVPTSMVGQYAAAMKAPVVAVPVRKDAADRALMRWARAAGEREQVEHDASSVSTRSSVSKESNGNILRGSDLEQFNEEHPRDAEGKFARRGVESGQRSPEVEERLARQARRRRMTTRIGNRLLAQKQEMASVSSQEVKAYTSALLGSKLLSSKQMSSQLLSSKLLASKEKQEQEAKAAIKADPTLRSQPNRAITQDQSPAESRSWERTPTRASTARAKNLIDVDYLRTRSDVLDVDKTFLAHSDRSGLIAFIPLSIAKELAKSQTMSVAAYNSMTGTPLTAYTGEDAAAAWEAMGYLRSRVVPIYLPGGTNGVRFSEDAPENPENRGPNGAEVHPSTWLNLSLEPEGGKLSQPGGADEIGFTVEVRSRTAGVPRYFSPPVVRMSMPTLDINPLRIIEDARNGKMWHTVEGRGAAIVYGKPDKPKASTSEGEQLDFWDIDNLLNKADPTWDESSVKRDQGGRFAVEGSDGGGSGLQARRERQWRRRRMMMASARHKEESESQKGLHRNSLLTSRLLTSDTHSSKLLKSKPFTSPVHQVGPMPLAPVPITQAEADDLSSAAEQLLGIKGDVQLAVDDTTDKARELAEKIQARHETNWARLDAGDAPEVMNMTLDERQAYFAPRYAATQRALDLADALLAVAAQRRTGRIEDSDLNREMAHWANETGRASQLGEGAYESVNAYLRSMFLGAGVASGLNPQPVSTEPLTDAELTHAATQLVASQRILEHLKAKGASQWQMFDVREELSQAAKDTIKEIAEDKRGIILRTGDDVGFGGVFRSTKEDAAREVDEIEQLDRDEDEYDAFTVMMGGKNQSPQFERAHAASLRRVESREFMERWDAGLVSYEDELHRIATEAGMHGAARHIARKEKADLEARKRVDREKVAENERKNAARREAWRQARDSALAKPDVTVEDEADRWLREHGEDL